MLRTSIICRILNKMVLTPILINLVSSRPIIIKFAKICSIINKQTMLARFFVLGQLLTMCIYGYSIKNRSWNVLTRIICSSAMSNLLILRSETLPGRKRSDVQKLWQKELEKRSIHNHKINTFCRNTKNRSYYGLLRLEDCLWNKLCPFW